MGARAPGIQPEGIQPGGIQGPSFLRKSVGKFLQMGKSKRKKVISVGMQVKRGASQKKVVRSKRNEQNERNDQKSSSEHFEE